MVLTLAAFTWACAPHSARRKPGSTVEAPPGPVVFQHPKVRSFTDTYAVTAIADTPSVLWLGSTHGLIRWDLAAGRATVLGAREGLPEGRVHGLAFDGQGALWVATPKATARLQGGTFSHLPPPPVGDFVTGFTVGGDGKTLWAAGPEGLARLRAGRWEHYLPDLAVTALELAPDRSLWVGTSGKGLLRVPRAADRIEQFGPPQGCETDVVRGLAVSAEGLFAVGDGASGPRAAWFDGMRFHSYAVESPQVLEWAASAGAQLLVGGGQEVYQLTVAPPEEKPEPKPPAASRPVRFQPLPAASLEPKRIALKAGLPSSALDEPQPAAGAAASGSHAPRLETRPAGFQLPDGVTALDGSPRGLLVGTRFVGAERIENGVERRFRVGDLPAGAQRLTVACKSDSECYLATGGARAWRFDGQTFEPAMIDPEPGARVLAVLRDQKGQVMAIHRGAATSKDHALRFSTVDDGRWTPTGIQNVVVPLGAPELNFAELAPDGHLWLGLRYVDQERDPVDYGAAEIDFDGGRVIYHRQGTLDGNTTFGLPLPSDMVSMYFRSPTEAWFATRSGAARLLDGKVRVFTENDGMESELVQAIGAGPDRREVWVATRHGTGRFDGARWRFPKLGPFYLPATAIAGDGRGHVFLGTEKGVYCVGECAPEAVDARRGLFEDAVLDLATDTGGRVWVLTQHAVSIIEP